MSTPYTDALTAVTRQRGVLGCLLVSEADGIIVDADVQVGIEAGVVGALVASLYRRARLGTDAAGLAAVGFLQLEAEHGHVCAVGRDGLVLATLAEPKAHIGLIRSAMLHALEAV
ncbi:MAG TPA: hypothetical protein VFW04_01705 [Gemmatimonadaceae bacterium]|nr:hypothetical protein [Gemmatimonadaceae bacterium]